MEAEELLKRFELVKRYTEGDRDFTGINLNEAKFSLPVGQKVVDFLASFDYVD